MAMDQKVFRKIFQSLVMSRKSSKQVNVFNIKIKDTMFIFFSVKYHLLLDSIWVLDIVDVSGIALLVSLYFDICMCAYLYPYTCICMHIITRSTFIIIIFPADFITFNKIFTICTTGFLQTYD